MVKIQFTFIFYIILAFFYIFSGVHSNWFHYIWVPGGFNPLHSESSALPVRALLF